MNTERVLTIREQANEDNTKERASLRRYAWLSIGAALLTIGLKTSAYVLTGSVGLLSDALESLVNLAGALMALAMLTIAARPADEEHAYGHTKAEYFSSGFEGGLILVAALVITLMPPRYQEAVASALRGTALKPFLALQIRLVKFLQPAAGD